MEVTVKMKIDNAAFADYGAAGEIARILREVAERVERTREVGFSLRDINGNIVGSVTCA